MEDAEDLSPLFLRPVPTADPTGSGAGAAPISISPATNVLSLNPGDTVDETITVTIPTQVTTAKVNVYFLADTTGSMGGILSAVQTGAGNVLAALGALSADMAFGVGEYKDFASGDPYAFLNQQAPTSSAAAVTAAINAWSASGARTRPRASSTPWTGWRSHLAGPSAGGPEASASSSGSATPRPTTPSAPPSPGSPRPSPRPASPPSWWRRASRSWRSPRANPGLDDDPKAGASDYNAQCGAPGGLAGQGTRIANATGGAFATGINASNIVNTIIGLVTGAVAVIGKVKLVPPASVAPFVTSITPAGGYGPLAGDQEHTLTFQVRFTGTAPCKPEAQVFTGTIDVVADGMVVARKKVQITVPPCRFVYSVKFVCGEQPECDCECAPVQPGRYATEINIHNFSVTEVRVLKRFVPLVRAGAPASGEPSVATTRAEDKIALPPQTATMDDGCRIAELLLGAPSPSPMPLTIGILEIEASGELAVTAVYTTSSVGSGGVSIAVEQIPGRRG